MAFTFGEVRQNLQKKGFQEDAKPRDHHYLYFYYKGKRSHLYTKTSRGKDREDVRHPVEKEMKMQLRLTTSQLSDLAKCPMGEPEYIKAMLERGELKEEEDKDKKGKRK